MRIKVGETVAVLSGKDRFFIDESGQKKIKTGKVLKIFTKNKELLLKGLILKLNINHLPKIKIKEA